VSDLSTIQPEDQEIELVHPANESGLGFYFTLRSPYHEKVKEAERKWLNKRLQKRKQKLTAESLDAAAEAKILAAVSGWRYRDETVTFDGQQPEFNPKELQTMLRKHAWIQAFLDEELGDFGNFFTT